VNHATEYERCTVELELVGVDKTIIKIWLMIHAVIFWNISNERNTRYFDGTSTPNHSPKLNVYTIFFAGLS